MNLIWPLKNSYSRFISISSILSSVSNQDRGWGCIADNVLPKSYKKKRVNVIKVFIKALTNLLTDIEKTSHSVNINPTIYNEIINIDTIFHTNIVDFVEIPEGTMDFILTSPPYPNMVDYTTSQRLSYYCFGEERIVEVIGKERRKN